VYVWYHNLGLGTYCGLPPVGWVHIYLSPIPDGIYTSFYTSYVGCWYKIVIKYHQVLGTTSVPYFYRDLVYVGIQYDHDVTIVVGSV
jgi:hypothetical protein